MMMRTALVSFLPSTANLVCASSPTFTNDELTCAASAPVSPSLRRWGRISAQLPLGLFFIWALSLYDALTNGTKTGDCLYEAALASRLYFLRLITDDPTVTLD